MAKDVTDVVTTQKSPGRHVAESIHYEMSYILQGEEHGPNGAIVLLHDIPAGAFVWEGIMPQLAGLSRAVYAIDMLGYGQSAHPWPADTSPWGQADVINFLLRSLNLTNVILVGHGLGGSVAQILATRLFRERTLGLVLIDSLCYLNAFAPNWPLPDMHSLQDFDAPQNTSLEDLMRNLRATLPNGSANADRFNNVMNNYIEQWDSELGKEVLLQHIRLLVPTYVNAVSSDLKMLEKPTLIIWGVKDEVVPEIYAQRLHRDIPNSQLVVVPDAGHLILFDAPDAVANALTNFIKDV